MLRMTLLGVGTAVPDQDRENTHMVWEAPDGLLLIDSGGFKVNPLEVEAALMEHPEVADCAVTAMDQSDTIQRVCAIVVAKDATRPPSERALRSFLLDRLAPAKVPRRIAFEGFGQATVGTNS